MSVYREGLVARVILMLGLLLQICSSTPIFSPSGINPELNDTLSLLDKDPTFPSLRPNTTFGDVYNYKTWPKRPVQLRYVYRGSPIYLDFIATEPPHPLMKPLEATHFMQMFHSLYWHAQEADEPSGGSPGAEFILHRGFSERQAKMGTEARGAYAFVGPHNERTGVPRDVVLAVTREMWALGKEFEERSLMFQVGGINFGTRYRTMGRVTWDFSSH